MTSQDRDAQGLRMLLGREWILGAVVVLLAMGVCIVLGVWQYGRFEERRTEARLVEANYDAEPVDLDAILPAATSDLPTEDEWRPVTLRGEYCTAEQCVLYVRNRTLAGQVGFWQLVPFESDQGTLLVVRGWVGTQGDTSAPADPPAVPAGPREVTVRMRPAEPALTDRADPARQLHSTNPERVLEQTGDLPDLRLGAYGELASEDPAAADAPTSLETPQTGVGPHLSYAVQWWVFALFFPLAWILRARSALKDARAEGTDQPAPQRPGPAGPHRRRPRRRTEDEEEEDALVDQRYL